VSHIPRISLYVWGFLATRTGRGLLADAAPSRPRWPDWFPACCSCAGAIVWRSAALAVNEIGEAVTPIQGRFIRLSMGWCATFDVAERS